jgi:pimeloyl-ACP methyl ester carboxylesterase
MPVASVGGLPLYYEWHGRPAGTPVVLVMGLGGDGSAWAYQLAALAPRHRVLVFDNRGAGRSGAPDVPYTTAAMAGDLLGLLDELDVARVHLVGLSLGGAIAQEAALAAPARVASLQLHATWAGPHPYFEALVRAVRTARVRLAPEEFFRTLALWLFVPETFARQPALVELVVQRAVEPPHLAPLHGYLRQTEAALGHDARPRLREVRCPTLVGVGSADLLTPPFFAEELARLVPGARLELLPRAGHGALWEAPEQFNRLCLTFLAEVAPD